MTTLHGFKLIKEMSIPELQSDARLYRHIKTGAELVSLSNADSNKVFGITFRTPPTDSTGVAHILEHSVLCGSRKYPVKEPFVELLKGSLQTFLNAFTYPDKTCYPVASQNTQDFYNLIDVYLDAVFYPRITPHIFEQEGWHYEQDGPDDQTAYKGVVFNEMKGAYSSPDSLLHQYSQQAVFPDTTYGLESGGAPGAIPDLTYEQFHLFHQNYYHPSNARLYMYGDDDPAERLRLLSTWLDAFERCEPESSVALQTPFVEPQSITRPYPAGDSAAALPKAMLTVNWLLPETCDTNANMALCILEYILLGMPASPLKKALIDSGLGDGLAGVGLENELRQLYFSTGLKGIKPEAADKVEALIIETLTRLVNEGIDSRTKEAAFNTIEFRLRENNTGHFPRGLIIMLRSLTTWLYDNDPFSMMAFDAPLAAVKKAAGQQTRFFEDLIERHFLKNRHRSTLLLRPDKDLAARQADDERQRLSRETGSLSPAEQQQIQDNTRELKKLQQAPDPAEALASIPRLGLDDLDKHNTPLPLETSQHSRAEILYHDLFTSDIIYLDIGLNLHLLPTEQLPYAPLLGRVLLESGTEQEDFVTLSQRISRTTGGISSSLFTSAAHGNDRTAAWLFLRGKAMARQGQEMLDIIADVLQSARLDDRQRFKQILLQEKAAQEQRLIPRGHQLTRLRLMAHFHEAAAADEATSGISYLLFLRELEHAIEHDWDRIQKTLESMRRLLVNRAHMIVNITTDEKNRDSFCPGLHSFIDRLPAATASIPDWSFAPLAQNEGLTVPSTVNYVGKAADIYDLGYTYNGSINVITHFIRNTWLWEQVRVLGGAYGGFCTFDRMTGGLAYVSYRDPNLMQTIKTFDATAEYLRTLSLHEDERIKSIIGAIGAIDAHLLPDAKGYISLQRHLIGYTETERQKIRDEVLATTAQDFSAFADVLQEVASRGIVTVLGADKSIQDANDKHGDFLAVTKVM